MTPERDLFAYADERRNRGMASAISGQPDWGETAYLAICDIARRQRTVHVDDVLAVVSAKPRHPNAWGSIWMRAIREGIIERTGLVRKSEDAKKNSHQYPIYRSLMFSGE